MLLLLISLKLLAKRVHKLRWIGAMGPIMCCIIGVSAVAAGNLENRGIKIVKYIPQGVSLLPKKGRGLRAYRI